MTGKLMDAQGQVVEFQMKMCDIWNGKVPFIGNYSFCHFCIKTDLV